MTDKAAQLRKAADEIADEGHAGWGPACIDGADEIDALRSHIAELYVERDQAQAALAEALEVVNGIAGFAVGNGPVCEIIAKRCRALLAKHGGMG